MDERSEISTRYTRFAEEEARGRSPLYEAIARGVAADREVIGFLSDLAEGQATTEPAARGRAPSVRHADGLARLSRASAVGSRCRPRGHASRSTQTNEPARCATLLPVLAQLPQPLALIEVGASAGLCLLPDHYGYDYGRAILGPRSPTFRCAVNDAAPIPAVLPRIVWRAGLDLNPLDRSTSPRGRVARDPGLARADRAARQPASRAQDRGRSEAACRQGRSRRRRACAARARSPEERHAGDLPHARCSPMWRIRRSGKPSRERAMRLGTWISNEMPDVFPDIAVVRRCAGAPGRFLLSVNGTPVAWTDSARSLRSIGSSSPGLCRRRARGRQPARQAGHQHEESRPPPPTAPRTACRSPSARTRTRSAAARRRAP